MRAGLISPSAASSLKVTSRLTCCVAGCRSVGWRTCVAHAGLWKTDGGLGAQVAPALRELPNQPRVRESATPTKKAPIDILPKAGTYRETGVGFWLRERKLLGFSFLCVVPLCWLLLSCVESAISVLGRGQRGGGPGRAGGVITDTRIRGSGASKREGCGCEDVPGCCLPPTKNPSGCRRRTTSHTFCKILSS